MGRLRANKRQRPDPTYVSLIGAFDVVTGLSDLGNGMWLALSYGPTALTGTVQLIGDLDGDGFVGIADLNTVLGNWNQSVLAGVALSGDSSGDGFVGIADLNFVLGNWNNGTPPGASVSVLVLQPGTLYLLSLGLGLIGFRPKRAGKTYHRSTGVERPSIGRSMAMRGRMHIAAAVLVAGLLGASPAGAAISFDLTPVDNSALLTGYVTYDLQVTTDTDWTAAAGLLELTVGSIYQHAQGVVSGPPNPFLISLLPLIEFDTYVSGTAIGGAGDIGGTGLAFNDHRLDVSWYNMTDTDIGTTAIGRLTLTDDATGSLSIMLTTENKEVAEFTIALESGTAQASVPSGSGSAPAFGSNADILANYPEPRDGLFVPGMIDTRPFTPTVFFTDKPIIPNVTRHARVIPIPESSESSTPEPGSLALIGTCLGVAALRRR